MKTTFILTIFGLLALANAQRPYADPRYGPPAPTARRLAKRAVISPYANPGYEQPAYKRLAKRDLPAPVTKINIDKRLAKRDLPAPYAYPNDYHVAAAYPGPAPVTKINIVERLAKRDAAIYADPDVDPRVAPVGDVLAAYADPDVITRYARDLVEEEGDARKANPEPQKAYANPGYKQPAYKRLAKRAAPVAKTNDYLCFCDLWTTSTCRQVCTIG